MQISEFMQSPVVSLPPIHMWPKPIKQVTLWLTVLICVITYILLFGGLLVMATLLLNVGFV